ncbi:MAG: hypothetical protein H6551_12270 [Chitinophagales bacterium]|nr:hypothetical protein [Chitinophagaceae bacterium]MCB9065905.1 hypothetical protein [Chitinophagales bacterium]
MEKQDKNSWVGDVMNSTEGMQKAMPPDGLFAKIESKLNSGVTYVKTVPMRTVFAVAASLALLISVNVYILNKIKTTTKSETKDDMETVIEYYGLDNQTNIYL